MRIEKENQFSSFSKLLTRIDATNLGDYEIKVLKQEHDYLDRLRHQRIKIEQLKNKYDDCEGQLNQQRNTNAELRLLLSEKCQTIEQLQQTVESQSAKRQLLQKSIQKQLELDKTKNKSKVRDLEQENQQLRKQMKQKQLYIISLEQQYTQKFRKIKQGYQAQRRSLLLELDDKINEIKSKNSQNQVIQLRNLVSRQNKALKLQNQKFQQLSQRNQTIESEYQELKVQYSKKQQHACDYQEKIRWLQEQLQMLQSRIEKQDHNNKLKGQLDEIRRKMTEMQKGQIERIQLIVNQMQ